MNGTKFRTLLVLVSFGLCLFAQDARFSQFYASPLTLNPAFTGLINSKYRVTSIIRSQGLSMSAPMTTYGSSFDINFGKDPFAEHFFGVGITALNDFGQFNGLVQNQFLASGAFHKILNRRHIIAYGIQIGPVITSTNMGNDLMFPDNVNAAGNGFDTGLGNEVGFQTSSFSFDLNTGLGYLGKIGRHSIFSGVSIYHLLPSRTGLIDNAIPLAQRYTLHGGVKIKILEQYRVTPHFVYQSQQQYREMNIGSNFEINIPDNAKPYTIISTGSYLRLNGGGNDDFIAPNALIIMAGISFMDFNLGLAYDINMNTYQEKNYGINAGHQYGFEISLAYEGMLQGKKRGRITVGCPKW